MAYYRKILKINLSFFYYLYDIHFSVSLQFHWFYSLVSLLFRTLFLQVWLLGCVPSLSQPVLIKSSSLSHYRYSQWASTFQQVLLGRKAISIFFLIFPNVKLLFIAYGSQNQPILLKTMRVSLHKTNVTNLNKITPIRLKHFSNWNIFISNLLLKIINYSKNLKV